MGYRTVMNVPSFYSFEKAKAWHDKTTPIRGRNPEVRPLGERRDVDTYSIRLNAEGDVECVLYRTPVVTYKQNGDVVLWMNGWNSVASRQFISQMVGVSAYGKDYHTVIRFQGGAEHVMDKDAKLTIRRGTLGGWTVMDAQVRYGYAMNREKASAVKAKNKPVYDYFGSMIKLRASEGRIMFTGAEFAGAGVIEFGENLRKKAMELVQEAGKTDDVEIQYKAFLHVAAYSIQGWYAYRMLAEPERLRPVNTTALKELMRELMLRAHAHEVLDRVALPPGKTPNRKYRDWVGDEA